MSLRRFLLPMIAVGLGALPGPGRVLAQAVQVTPVQVELTPRTRNAIVTVENLGTQPMRFQVSAFGWQQDARGEMQLTRTKDITFFPGLFTIAAGQKRNLRVATTAAFGDFEKTYRVFVEQLPGGPGAAETSVRVLTRVGIPVYLSPPRPARGAEVSPLRIAGGKISFVLRNTGNVRLRPEAVRLVGKDEKGEVVFEQPLNAWYVLAGGERVFEVPASREGCARVRTLSAEVLVDKAALQAQTSTPDGACGP